MVIHLLNAPTRVVNDVSVTSIPCPDNVRPSASACADDRPCRSGVTS